MNFDPVLILLRISGSIIKPPGAPSKIVAVTVGGKVHYVPKSFLDNNFGGDFAAMEAKLNSLPWVNRFDRVVPSLFGGVADINEFEVEEIPPFCANMKALDLELPIDFALIPQFDGNGNEIRAWQTIMSPQFIFDGTKAEQTRKDSKEIFTLVGDSKRVIAFEVTFEVTNATEFEIWFGPGYPGDKYPLIYLQLHKKETGIVGGDGATEESDKFKLPESKQPRVTLGFSLDIQTHVVSFTYNGVVMPSTAIVKENFNKYFDNWFYPMIPCKSDGRLVATVAVDKVKKMKDAK